ncbi:kinase domain protein, putative (macronuclear) [Tetrahymena thermophila SB210]|uniref:Kinase domain protein, putative n=1 Tax=Tetrahymena thermophila (strain SB210) TaxID=312017 RepID=Q24CB1_TETTS|nr:kinase domain protein, putative [Tetrahymena thermophila SB210]EAS05327.2 kinase domain protein, putative [Tetrahymena thermophila SB210]|eukprot:XP_001025572.2 kinase domain protein, putative [Tetrahymena thermophila SB210]
MWIKGVKQGYFLDMMIEIQCMHSNAMKDNLIVSKHKQRLMYFNNFQIRNMQQNLLINMLITKITLSFNCKHAKLVFSKQLIKTNILVKIQSSSLLMKYFWEFVIFIMKMLQFLI